MVNDSMASNNPLILSIMYLHNDIYHSRAYNLIDMAVTLTIIGLLFGMMYPSYVLYMDELKSVNVEEELKEIDLKIDDWFIKNGHYPDSLDEVISPPPLDPWGNPYEYLRIDGGSEQGKGKLRKDKNLVPINSDYDLYSMGPDGDSMSPLTANPSKDDIVRGRNGDFIGVATEY